MMDILTLISYVAASLTLLFTFVCLIIFSLADTYPQIIIYEQENYYFDGSRKKKFPSLFDEPSLSLTVIVPAYNEEKRLPKMLDECIEFLESRDPPFNYEIIVVDDGSKDKTSEVASGYSKKYGTDKIRVLMLLHNRGKGGAVRLGMLHSRGRLLMFADADGATKFSDYTKVEESIRKICTNKEDFAAGKGITCGSRAHLEEESIATRSYFRTFLMYGFHGLVWLFTVRSVRDTQCGFKLFTRKTGQILFSSVHIEGWAFDVEMLYIAEKLGIPISEVPVTWTEIEGSKVTPILSWLQMGKDLLLIWFRYRLGAWNVRSEFTKAEVSHTK